MTPVNPSQRLKGRVAIVTGSSQGIGREICEQFHSEGAFVVCADLRPNGLQMSGAPAEVNTHDAIKQDGGKAIFVETDVTKAASMEAVVNKAVEEYGRLDIMVNNAGLCTEAKNPKPIDESDEAVFDAHINVNVRGTFLGCKYAVRQMKKQEPLPRGDRGFIVNLASIVTLVGMAGMPNYCATKGAIGALTKEVALDGSKYKIHCNAICPGYSQTPMLTDALAGVMTTPGGTEAITNGIPLGRFGEPRDIARAAVFFCSDDASWITAALLPVDGGITAQ